MARLWLGSVMVPTVLSAANNTLCTYSLVRIRGDFVRSFETKLNDTDWHNYIVTSVMCACVFGSLVRDCPLFANE